MDSENTGKVIRLRYDSDSNSRSEVVQYHFRVMYWAAFIGRADVVDHLIGHGYSPFLQSLHKQNALMAAVDANQTKIV
jgi:hypothetical protein